jgi:hypothetical protein
MNLVLKSKYVNSKLTIITDITSCQPYEIPKVSDGTFYTEPQGKGTK